MLNITEDNYKEELSEGLVLVKFYSDDCVPCKMLAPLIKELELQFKDIKFTEVDTSEYPSLSLKYNVSGLPTLLFMKDGVVIDKKIGLVNKKDLVNMLKDIAEKN